MGWMTGCAEFDGTTQSTGMRFRGQSRRCLVLATIMALASGSAIATSVEPA
jgi:hypothetical protein